MRSALILLVATTCLLPAADWPQWLGPQRDSVWRETGIITSFPEKGPEIAWRVPVGYGYSGPAVAGNRVYLMDYQLSGGDLVNDPGKAIDLKGKERILCFDAGTGALLWEHATPRDYLLSYPGGPRCTTTVTDGKVYALGAMGDLSCLDADSGNLHWEVNLPRTFKGTVPIWGYSAHPLVHDGNVYTMGGGPDGVAVALDQNTGETVWTALKAPQPGYCPPSVFRFGGAEQLIIWTPESLNSLDPADGSVHWSQPLKPNFNMSVTIPQRSGNKLFASAIGRIGALYELDPNQPAAKRLWKGKPKTAVYCSNSTPVIVGDTIYGVDIDTSLLMGVAMKDGERLWETTEPTTGKEGNRIRHGTAFLTYHEPSKNFFLFNEIGELIIARLTPEGYTEISSAHILEPTNEAFGRPVVWSSPAFAMKSAFMRNDKELVRVKLAK